LRAKKWKKNPKGGVDKMKMIIFLEKSSALVLSLIFLVAGTFWGARGLNKLFYPPEVPAGPWWFPGAGELLLGLVVWALAVALFREFRKM
jgi:hypothetical protein